MIGFKMDIILTLKILVVLVVVLGVLIFFFLKSSKQKRMQQKKEPKELNMPKELDELAKIIKDVHSTTKQLRQAVNDILKYHGKIYSETLGKKVVSDFDIYGDIIINLCKHPNTTKDLILTFDKELEKLNPDFKSEISNILMLGLDARN